MASPGHLAVAADFVTDLADAVAHHGENRGRAATYGGIVD